MSTATYEAEIHPAARAEFDAVPEDTRARIRERIDDMCRTADPLGVKHVFQIRGPYDGLMRVREGDWRAVCALEKPRLRVLLVDRRSRVYDRLDVAERRRQDGEVATDGGIDSADSEQFEHEGLECKILRTDIGHWCGYVQAPDDIGPVRWTSDYDSKYNEVIDAEVDVWGGITYGPDDEGWVGFDDGHSRSLREVKWSGAGRDRHAVRVETMKLAEQIRALHTGEHHER